MPPRDPDERELWAVRSAAGAEDADPVDADDDLHRLGRIARSMTDEDDLLDDPPPDVWAGIAARVDAAEAADDVDPPTVLRPRGDHRRWWLGAAAAAVAVVLAVVGVVVLAGDRGTGDRLLASARLDPLAGTPPTVAPVTADLVEAGDRLRLDLPLTDADLPRPAGFYEVWLIDPNVEGMISLGPARDDGTYAVPGDVDYRDFPIVDVSLEAADGNPTHSGDSVLRGTLAS
jgi:hypothetical protein